MNSLCVFEFFFLSSAQYDKILRFVFLYNISHVQVFEEFGEGPNMAERDFIFVIPFKKNLVHKIHTVHFFYLF